MTGRGLLMLVVITFNRSSVNVENLIRSELVWEQCFAIDRAVMLGDRSEIKERQPPSVRVSGLHALMRAKIVSCSEWQAWGSSPPHSFARPCTQTIDATDPCRGIYPR